MYVCLNQNPYPLPTKNKIMKLQSNKFQFIRQVYIHYIHDVLYAYSNFLSITIDNDAYNTNNGKTNYYAGRIDFIKNTIWISAKF